MTRESETALSGTHPESQMLTPLEALARAYDREDASQRGEPTPWDDAEDLTWRAERIACAEVGWRAYLSAIHSQEAAPSEEPVAYWVPENLRKTVGGQLVGLQPLHCESKGVSDYCRHCSRDMVRSTGEPNVCSELEKKRLGLIPDQVISAFGCAIEADLIRDHPNDVTRCERWCHKPGCSFALRASPAPVAVAPVGVKALEDQLVIREARRLEILDWLQDEIGTAWNCSHCGYSTYHSNANECADCGTEFPTLNMLAFKLHASGTETQEYIDQARDDFGFAIIPAGKPAMGVVKDAWEADVDDLVQSVAEWDDRTSTDEYLLITPAELKEFARDVAALSGGIETPKPEGVK